MKRPVVFALAIFLIFGVISAGCSGADSVQPNRKELGESVSGSASSTAESEEDAPIPSEAAVTSLVADALRTGGSISHEALVNRLGAPGRVEREPVPNQYVADRVDTLRTLMYSGIEALIYDVSGKPRSFLVRLALSSGRYATPEGIRVGTTPEEVEATLGPPTERRSGGTLIYQETGPAPTTMTLTVQDNRVGRIEWTFYVS